MSYKPHELTQVEFVDEDDAVEQGQLQVDFADNHALLDQLDSLDSPVTSSTRRRSGSPWFTLCLVVIPLLGAFATGLYFLTNAASSTSSTSTTTTTTVIALQAPPANIATKCLSVSDECRMVCEPAACCDFPANLALSCLLGNEATCLVYHTHCSILDNGGDQPVQSNESIPPAPSNLATICAPEAIASVTGFQECQEACRVASCCYDSGDDASCTNTECSGYAPCLVLSAVDNVDPSIPIHVADECSDLDTVEGRSLCRVACSHALCCFYKDKNTCPQPDSSFCDQYTVCNDLEANVNVVAQADEISQICNSFHTSLCEIVCERGACCFASGHSSSCPSSDINCVDYGACGNIYGDSQDDDNPQGNSQESPEGDGDDDEIGMVFKVDVDDACINFDPGAASADGDALCPKLCAGVGCCFQPNGCTNSSINCYTYKECDIVYETDETSASETNINAQVTANAIIEACDDPTVETTESANGETLCHALCSPFKCCFSGCTIASNVECSVGAGCAVLYKSNGPTSSTGNPVAQGSSPTVAPTSGDTSVLFMAIMEACEVVDDKQDCESLCVDGRCCFESQNCDAPSDVNCADYKGCLVLYAMDGNDGDSSGNNDELSDAILAACANGSNMQDCETLCADGRCCFDSQNCDVPSDIPCDDYLGCSALYEIDNGDGDGDSGNEPTQSPESSNEQGNSELYDTIMAACEVDSDMQDCQSLCVDGRCCFESEDCEVPTGIVCNDYQGCLVIYAMDGGDGDGDGNPPTPASDEGVPTSSPSLVNGRSGSELYDTIMAACEEGTNNLQECEAYCVDGQCCFESQHCDPPSDTNCQDYAGCMAIYASDPSSSMPSNEYTAADIAAACSDSTVASMCRKMCNGSECCFHPDLTCSDVMQQQCDKYLPCSVVWTRL